MTAELIREGQELVKREKNKLLRQMDTSDASRVRKTAAPVGEHQPLATNQTSSSHMSHSTSDENVRRELLNDVEPIDYSTNYSSNYYYSSTTRPQKGLFDDIWVDIVNTVNIVNSRQVSPYVHSFYC